MSGNNGMQHRRLRDPQHGPDRVPPACGWFPLCGPSEDLRHPEEGPNGRGPRSGKGAIRPAPGNEMARSILVILLEALEVGLPWPY